jgi:CRP-like cAMP-binding protein
MQRRAHARAIGERSVRLDALAHFPLFRDAQSITIDAILQDANLEEHAAKTVIVRRGEAARFVYFVLEGTARVFVGEAGVALSTEIVHAPGRFGDAEAIAGFAEHRASVEAITDVVVARVSSELINASLEADHGLCFAWLLGAARDHGAAIDGDRQCVLGGLSARTAHVLLAYGERGDQVSRSYTELAQDVGCSRRSAITVMQTLERKGAISAGNAGWRIDRERLITELVPVTSPEE